MAALSRVRRRADAQFVLVDHAYRVLSDPVKKQARHRNQIERQHSACT